MIKQIPIKGCLISIDDTTIIENKSIRGGRIIVTDIQERDAIKIEDRMLGMLAYVIDEDIEYILKGDLTNANWEEKKSNSGNFFRGMIIPFYGTIADIPDGWALCDGTNGTPDMSDKFVIGVGNEFELGETGGSLNQPLSGTIGDTTLTIDQMPSHTHVTSSVSGTNKNAGITGAKVTLPASSSSSTSSATGGSLSHTHDLVTAEVSFLPPFIALYHIMKL